MKISFIRPNMTNIRSSDAMQPLVFAILAWLTPEDVEVVLYDDGSSRSPSISRRT